MRGKSKYGARGKGFRAGFQLTFGVGRGKKDPSNPISLKENGMASRTGKTRMARKVKQARKGKTRKRKEQNKGTTPKFAVHKK